MNLTVTSASHIGRRDANEDRIVCTSWDVLSSFKTRRYLWAIFDGHGGSQAAEIAHNFLLQDIQDELLQSTSLPIALQRTVARLEQRISSACRHHSFTSGTTASIVLFDLYDDKNSTPPLFQEFHVAHVGDSPVGILHRFSCFQKIQRWTKVHTASSSLEIDRIYENGGYINHKEGYRPRPSSFVVGYSDWLNPRPWRAYPGGLVCTRTLGDMDVKGVGHIIALPTVQTFKISTSKSMYIWLASDGYMDVWNDGQLSRAILRYASAGDIVEAAVNIGVSDNTSLIIGHFT